MSTTSSSTRADPAASVIFKALADGEKCICELKEAMGIPQTWKSYDLMRLEDLDAIKSRSVDGWKYYSLGESRVRWYLRRYVLAEEKAARPMGRPVEYRSAMEQVRKTMPSICEFEAVLRRGC